MLPSDLNGNITTRLKTIKGQVEGIINMLEGGSNDPEQIVLPHYTIISLFFFK